MLRIFTRMHYDCMGQVREAVGFALCVMCSNILLFTSFGPSQPNDVQKYDFSDDPEGKGWKVFLAEQSAGRAVKILNTVQTVQSSTPVIWRCKET